MTSDDGQLEGATMAADTGTVSLHSLIICGYSGPRGGVAA